MKRNKAAVVLDALYMGLPVKLTPKGDQEESIWWALGENNISVGYAADKNGNFIISADRSEAIRNGAGFCADITENQVSLTIFGSDDEEPLGFVMPIARK